jgi:hypothetical protein
VTSWQTSSGGVVSSTVTVAWQVGKRQWAAGDVEKALDTLRQSCRTLQGWVDRDPQSEVRRGSLKEAIETCLDRLLAAAGDGSQPAPRRDAWTRDAEDWFARWEQYRRAAAGRATIEDTRPGASEDDDAFRQRVDAALQALARGARRPSPGASREGPMTAARSPAVGAIANRVCVRMRMNSSTTSRDGR